MRFLKRKWFLRTLVVLCCALVFVLINARNTKTTHGSIDVPLITRNKKNDASTTNEVCPRRLDRSFEDSVKRILKLPTPPFADSYLKQLGILASVDVTAHNNTTYQHFLCANNRTTNQHSPIVDKTTNQHSPIVDKTTNQHSPRAGNTKNYNFSSVDKTTNQHSLSVDDTTYQNSLCVDNNTSYQHALPVVIAASSAEFFFTLQGLIKNLHMIRMTYPKIRIVFYDLGLTKEQMTLMKQYCKCEVKSFPFERFPSHVQDLRLYAWKPILIQLALNDYGFVMYMDTSIRITSPDKLTSLFQRAQHTGFLYTREDHPRFTLVEHTDRRTFEYLGEVPCTFEGIPDRQAGFVLMTRTPFTQQLIMRHWLACVLEPECICPQGARERYVCDTRLHWYGKCHRYDQSVLNIVVSRLYRPPIPVPVIPSDLYVIRRGEKVAYFPQVE